MGALRDIPKEDCDETRPTDLPDLMVLENSLSQYAIIFYWLHVSLSQISLVGHVWTIIATCMCVRL